MKGGNKPGGNDEITVRDVDPDTAFQGEMLEIEVSGSGFDPSSIVDFELNGQPTDDITVQSTTPEHLIRVYATAAMNVAQVGTGLWLIGRRADPRETQRHPGTVRQIL